MALKLMSSGGGSVTLDVPSTASNLAMTVPAVAGTVLTSASTDNFPSGTVVKRSITTYTTQVNYTNATGNTEYNSNATFSYTPKYADSVLYITYSCFVWKQAGTAGVLYGYPVLYKNGSILASGIAAEYVTGTLQEISYKGTNTVVHSPASTSAITFSLRWYNQSTVTLNNLTFQRNGAPSTIDIMEVRP